MPLKSEQLTAHFNAVQSLVKHTIETRQEIELRLRSPVPRSRAIDAWRLRLYCAPQLVGDGVEFVAAHAIDLLIEEPEDDSTCDPTWDAGAEVITSAVELPVVTAAIASCFLIEGWLGTDSGFEACRSTECTFSFVGDSVLASQPQRGAARPAFASHTERANERRAPYLAREVAREADAEAAKAGFEAWCAAYVPIEGEGTLTIDGVSVKVDF